MGTIDGEIPNIIFLLSAIGFWIFVVYIQNKKHGKTIETIFFVNFSYFIFIKLFWSYVSLKKSKIFELTLFNHVKNSINTTIK